MSLLLKALTQKQSRLTTQRDALQLRDENHRNRAEDAPRRIPAAVIAAEEVAENRYIDDVIGLNPADYISGEAAIIEPFEPYAETVTEFLAADALPDFDEIDAKRPDVAGPIETAPTAEVEVSLAEDIAHEYSTQPVAESAIPAVWSRLEELQQLILEDREKDAVAPELAQPRIVAPLVVPPILAEPTPLPKLPLREEYRELRDHLLTRFPLTKPATLLVVDAGRVTCDSSWLVPLAASIVQHFNETQNRVAKVLVVEAAGPECSVARGLALECASGLTDVLGDFTKLSAAVTPTEHSQIRLLARGTGSARRDDRERLARLWPELQRQFDVIFIAAGPLDSLTANSRQALSTVELFAPLADGVIASVELAGTPRGVAANTCRRLNARGTKLIGCVVHGDAA